jgi:hypothetical protein
MPSRNIIAVSVAMGDSGPGIGSWREDRGEGAALHALTRKAEEVERHVRELEKKGAMNHLGLFSGFVQSHPNEMQRLLIEIESLAKDLTRMTKYIEKRDQKQHDEIARLKENLVHEYTQHHSLRQALEASNAVYEQLGPKRRGWFGWKKRNEGSNGLVAKGVTAVPALSVFTKKDGGPRVVHQTTNHYNTNETVNGPKVGSLVIPAGAAVTSGMLKQKHSSGKKTKGNKHKGKAQSDVEEEEEEGGG